MFRFNWEVIKRYGRNPKTSLDILYALSGKKKFIGNQQVFRSIIDNTLVKDSFLINIERLLSNPRNASMAETFVYVDLAARRSLAEYKRTDRLWLPHYFVPPSYKIAQLKANRLLYITDTRIYFTYEVVGRDIGETLLI